MRSVAGKAAVCMSGEYWAGWFGHWGEEHQVTDSAKQAAEFTWMLRQGYLVSIYMFDGGTSFGWMNGANSNGKDFQPDTTSYDYDARIDKKGEPRAKFFAFRDAMTSASLWRNLPEPVDAFWSVGPQFALYTPAPWLHEGSNDVVFFDLKGTPADVLKSGTEPIFNMSGAEKATARGAK